MIDQTIQTTERALGDEFYIRKYHESNTYALMLMTYLGLVSCIAIAALAENPWFSFIPLAGIAIANEVGTRRLRKEVPTPILPKPFSPARRTQIITNVVLAIAWVSVLAWRIGENGSFLIGGICGAVVTVLFFPYLNRKQHKRDTARIEAELDD